MDPLLDFVLTITGLRFVFEAIGVLVVMFVVLAAITVLAVPWCQTEQFRARLGSA